MASPTQQNPIVPVLIVPSPTAPQQPSSVLVPQSQNAPPSGQVPTATTGGGGAGASIFPGVYPTFPPALLNPGMFAIDPTFPGGGQATLYCSFGGVWCFMQILAP